VLALSQQSGDANTRRRAEAVLASLNKGADDDELRAKIMKASSTGGGLTRIGQEGEILFGQTDEVVTAG
jgi:hypothetical protein